MSRAKTFQLSEQTVANKMSHQVANDNAIVNSRTMCRFDLTSNNRFGEINGYCGSPNARYGLENIPSSTMTSGPITQINNFSIPSLNIKHHLGFKSEYDISKKLEDFIGNTTPRQLTKSSSSVIPAAG